MEKENLTEVSEMILNKAKEANEKLTADLDEKVTKVQNNLDQLETELVKKVTAAQKATTTRGLIYNALKEADLKQYESRRPGTRDLQLNAIHQPTNFTDGDAPVVLPFREAGVDKTQYAPTLLSDIIAWGTTASNMVDWIERKAKSDGAAMRDEDGKMSEGSLSYEEKSTKVRILSEFMKATNESLKDVGFLAGEINSELLDDLKNLLEDQLMNGDGTGSNLLGILPQATPSDMTAFAASVEEANEADVLRVVLNQIYVARDGRFMPNYILMHPTDVTRLDLLKIADGRYIEVPFYKGDTMILARVPIIQSTRVAVGEYLVGDFTKAKAFLRDSLSIRIWDQNEDDVLYNRSTVTGNMRLAFRIKTYDKAAFVKGNFATDIALITV